MRRGIGVVIGLDLYDGSPNATDEQRRPDEFGCDLVYGTVEEATAKARGLGHALRKLHGAAISAKGMPVVQP